MSEALYIAHDTFLNFFSFEHQDPLPVLTSFTHKTGTKRILSVCTHAASRRPLTDTNVFGLEVYAIAQNSRKI
jgi:hypothetical protein